jgi:putative acetyltransferase
VIVRPEEPGDRHAALAVERAAFEGDDDIVLIVMEVRDLPGSFSFVAVEGTEVVGHAQFSMVAVGPDEVPSLGPIGVRPDRQGQGIGRSLIEAGIDEARRRGACAIVLLGDPARYGRFGFEPAARYGLKNPFTGTQEADFVVAEEDFQLLALDEQAARALTGTVRWHPVFGPSTS